MPITNPKGMRIYEKTVKVSIDEICVFAFAVTAVAVF